MLIAGCRHVIDRTGDKGAGPVLNEFCTNLRALILHEGFTEVKFRNPLTKGVRMLERTLVTLPTSQGVVVFSVKKG